jgi:hypothetical protein
MKTHILTLLEKIECLLYAVYVQSRIAMPSIQKASGSDSIFWGNVLNIAGLSFEKCDFQKFVVLAKASQHIEEMEHFGENMIVFKAPPPSWRGSKITQDHFYGKVLKILPSINRMLAALEKPTHIIRGQPID